MFEKVNIYLQTNKLCRKINLHYGIVFKVVMDIWLITGTLLQIGFGYIMISVVRNRNRKNIVDRNPKFWKIAMLITESWGWLLIVLSAGYLFIYIVLYILSRWFHSCMVSIFNSFLVIVKNIFVCKILLCWEHNFWQQIYLAFTECA